MTVTKRRKPTPRYPPSSPIQQKYIQQPTRPTLVTPTFLRIAFAGKICSGKTTLAKHVQKVAKQNSIEVENITFGDFVKKMAKEYFQYDDQKHNNRELLAQLETSMRHIHADVWVNRLRKKIKESDNKHWVVDDVRHKNEFDMLQELGFTIIRVDVPDNVQYERILERYPDTFEEYIALELHSTDREWFQGDAIFDKILLTDTGKYEMEQWVNDALHVQSTHTDIVRRCSQ